MNRDEARRDLTSNNPRLRLDAARFFAQNALTNEREALLSALRTEDIVWIRNALKSALKKIKPDSERVDSTEGDVYDSDLELAELRAEAQVRITGQLLHELEPMMGVLKVRLMSEWSGFSGSKSSEKMQRIESFLDALRDLNSASRIPSTEDVSLRMSMEELSEELEAEESEAVALAGPEITVLSNKAFLQLIVRNGIRNALEVSDIAGGGNVVVSWGRAGNSGYFISVVDQGPGPPQGAERNAFTIGTSSKAGHLGMGLAIANQASEALGGKLTLRQGRTGGAVLEFRVGQE